MSNTASNIRVHPDFSHPQDIVIQSNDGVRFFVAASDLVRASGVYRGSPPQPPSNSNGPQIISSNEDSIALEFLLKIATGRHPTLDQLATIDAIENVYHAAERLQMNVAMTMAMLLLRSKVMEMMDDPVKQYAMAARHAWVDLQPTFLARAVTVAIDFSQLPSMPADALVHLIAEREARITKFIGVMTWTHDPTLALQNENKNICPTCISTSRTIFLSPPLQVIWRSFQINAIVRFRSFPSLEHLPESEWVAKDLALMAEAKASCGHNPWKGIERKIPRLLDAVVPAPSNVEW